MEGIKEKLERDGWAVVDGVISPEECDRLVDE